MNKGFSDSMKMLTQWMPTVALCSQPNSKFGQLEPEL